MAESKSTKPALSLACTKEQAAHIKKNLSDAEAIRILIANIPQKAE